MQADDESSGEMSCFNTLQTWPQVLASWDPLCLICPAVF